MRATPIATRTSSNPISARVPRTPRVLQLRAQCRAHARVEARQIPCLQDLLHDQVCEAGARRLVLACSAPRRGAFPNTIEPARRGLVVTLVCAFDAAPDPKSSAAARTRRKRGRRRCAARERPCAAKRRRSPEPDRLEPLGGRLAACGDRRRDGPHPADRRRPGRGQAPSGRGPGASSQPARRSSAPSRARCSRRATTWSSSRTACSWRRERWRRTSSPLREQPARPGVA